MNLKKFSAATPRDALRLVRDALGPDAVILSNRTVNGAVEIVALAGDDMDSLVNADTYGSSASASPPALRSAQPEAARPTLTPSPSIRLVAKQGLMAGTQPAGAGEQATDEALPVLAAFARRRMDTQRGVPQARTATDQYMDAGTGAVPAGASAQTTAATASAAQTSATTFPPADIVHIAAPEFATADGAATGPHNALMAGQLTADTGAHAHSTAIDSPARFSEMMDEIRAMRSMLEIQLTELAWSAQQKREPARAVVFREMLSSGFSASLARYLTERLPADVGDPAKWMQSVLLRNLHAQSDERSVLDNGGVFALVGPTGVGKTTTTAKLAARCVMRHGAGKLALITTDGYRIGGHEQLRIYGKILGVIVHAVKDEADLRIALTELSAKHIVLIDTAGAGQRDQMVAEQVAMLQGAGTPVQRLLCMPATSTGETLNEVVRAYRGSGLAGCVLTKLDEAATIGSVLDVIIRQKLTLYYVANGQRVPEDLHLARPEYLIDRAFKLKRETAPFKLLDDELPAVIAGTHAARYDRSLREVILG